MSRRVVLTDRALMGLKLTPGKQTDYYDKALPNFGVRVGARTKTFFVVYAVNGMRRRQNLGEYDAVTLGDARKLAEEVIRQSSDEGRDPAAERKESQARTFKALAENYIELYAKKKKRSWQDDARMIRRQLETLHAMPVRDIKHADCQDLIDRLVRRDTPVLANRVFACLHKILKFGIQQGWLEAHPMSRMQKGTEQARQRVLTEEEIRTFWKAMESAPPAALDNGDRKNWMSTQRAWQLRLVTLQRMEEVVSMRWSDIEGSWWTIGGADTKNKLAHRVYLTKQALTIIKQQPDDGEFVFSGIRGKSKQASLTSIVKLPDFQPKDMRRTAATFMTSSGVPQFIVHRILNHKDAGITAVYDRSAYDHEKQVALTWWSTKLTAILKGSKASAAILPFRKVARLAS